MDRDASAGFLDSPARGTYQVRVACGRRELLAAATTPLPRRSPLELVEEPIVLAHAASHGSAWTGASVCESTGVVHCGRCQGPAVAPRRQPTGRGNTGQSPGARVGSASLLRCATVREHPLRGDGFGPCLHPRHPRIGKITHRSALPAEYLVGSLRRRCLRSQCRPRSRRPRSPSLSGRGPATSVLRPRVRARARLSGGPDGRVSGVGGNNDAVLGPEGQVDPLAGQLPGADPGTARSP